MRDPACSNSSLSTLTTLEKCTIYAISSVSKHFGWNCLPNQERALRAEYSLGLPTAQGRQPCAVAAASVSIERSTVGWFSR